MLAILEHSLNSVASMLQAVHRLPDDGGSQQLLWMTQSFGEEGLLSVPVQGFQNFRHSS